MHAIRAQHAFDGQRFLPGGATVLVADGRIRGVEPAEFEPPDGCDRTTHSGTLLPGLVDAHTHLVCDSGQDALTRVAGYTRAELDTVVDAALRDHLAAGVTLVRDLGARDFHVVGRRDTQRAAAGTGAPLLEPTIVAAGPPITTPLGHCHYLGGEVDGDGSLERAVAERADRRVDVVKVMASGGVTTPGTDVQRTQFDDATLRRLVDLSHAAGLAVTAHAHGTTAVAQALASGVDGIEHCSCVSEQAFGDAPDALVEALAASGVAVCPTLGYDHTRDAPPPPPLLALAAREGKTFEQLLADRTVFVAELHARGVHLVSGVDSGIAPPKHHGALPFAVLDLLAGGVALEAALRTATSDAAQACGVGDRKGRLSAGYDADLLLVDVDLRSDPSGLTRPHAVWLHGQPVS